MAIASFGHAVDLSASDKELYEKYGLSETEWILIKEKNIGLDELSEIMSHGVSIHLYISEPWKKLGIDRQKWLKHLREGYTAKEIDFMYKREPPPRNNIVPAFLLPGWYQYKRQEKVKGLCMAGSAVLSLGLFAFHHRDKDSARVVAFDRPIPWLATMFGSMLWSGIDMGVHVQRESNPDAARFSLIITDQTLGVQSHWAF